VNKLLEPKASSAHAVRLDAAQGRYLIAFGCRLTLFRMKACLAKKGSAEERSLVGMTPERQWSRMTQQA